MFSLAQILACSLAGTLATAAVVLSRRGALRRAIELGLVVGLSILLWRSAANTAALNDDPIPWVSPNDVLCPIVTYVTVGVYASLIRKADAAGPALRGLLTIVSLVVNVLTI